MDESTAMDQVQEVSDAVTDAVATVVPDSWLEVVHKFMQTWIGGIVGKLILIAVVLIVTGLVVRAVNHFFKKTVSRLQADSNSTATLVAFGRYLALAVVYFTAFSIIVSNIPVLNSGLTKLMAAGGVLVVVFGVAAQNVLGGIAAGIMILLFKPFVMGDVVNVVSCGVSGTVEEITLQHTVLRTVENKRVIIPNSTMNSAIVENFDYGDKRVCLPLNVGITYEADVEKGLEVLSRTVAAHPNYLDPRTPAEKSAGAPAVAVRVNELADSSVVLTALLWGKDNGTAVGMRFDLYKQVKKAFDEAGIDIAYPHLVVVGKEQV